MMHPPGVSAIVTSAPTYVRPCRPCSPAAALPYDASFRIGGSRACCQTTDGSPVLPPFSATRPCPCPCFPRPQRVLRGVHRPRHHSWVPAGGIRNHSWVPGGGIRNHIRRTRRGSTAGRSAGATAGGPAPRPPLRADPHSSNAFIWNCLATIIFFFCSWIRFQLALRARMSRDGCPFLGSSSSSSTCSSSSSAAASDGRVTAITFASASAASVAFASASLASLAFASASATAASAVARASISAFCVVLRSWSTPSSATAT
mmetsp:Transcript_49305/g.128635  ORF Transcript_49305/g.128635 Transcript_49305/m.128635 type:complete len:260 (-) Transcript_49305:1630-2409(-)